MEWGPEFWKQAGSDPCVHAAPKNQPSLQHPARKRVVRQCEYYLAPTLRHLSHQLQDGQMAAKLCGGPHITVHGNSGNSKGKTS